MVFVVFPIWLLVCDFVVIKLNNLEVLPHFVLNHAQATLSGYTIKLIAHVLASPSFDEAARNVSAPITFHSRSGSKNSFTVHTLTRSANAVLPTCNLENGQIQLCSKVGLPIGLSSPLC